MDFNEYQKAAMEFNHIPANMEIIYPALGLNGEAGEVAEKVKKAIRDNKGVFSDDCKIAIVKELGDILWYVAAMARDIGYDLQVVADANLHKLYSRARRGVLGGNGDDR